jgi:hypothetical protein
LIAEEVEVFSAVQNKGWNCGASNGEGLSRVLAESLYPGVLDDYSTAAAWLDTPDRPDWISNNNNTDTLGEHPKPATHDHLKTGHR